MFRKRISAGRVVLMAPGPQTSECRLISFAISQAFHPRVLSELIQLKACDIDFVCSTAVRSQVA